LDSDQYFSLTSKALSNAVLMCLLIIPNDNRVFLVAMMRSKNHYPFFLNLDKTKEMIEALKMKKSGSEGKDIIAIIVNSRLA
jgi:hypothetical protein